MIFSYCRTDVAERREVRVRRREKEERGSQWWSA